MANRSKRTPQKLGKFLAEFRRTGHAVHSGEYAGIPQSTLYEWREADAEFKAQWEAALEAYTQTMEREADRRAIEGTLKPIFYQGEVVGQIREYSDTLLMFRLNGSRPEKYRQRLEHTGKDGEAIQVNVNVKTTIEEALSRAYESAQPVPALSNGSEPPNGYHPFSG